MNDISIRICAFDDLPECRRALESLPTGVHAHVCDGRYANFSGDHDLTPGLEALCDERAAWHYHAPDDYLLPFGANIDAPDEWRPGVYAKAHWMEAVLPQDEWALKLDTDERLRTFDVDLGDLDRRKKYAPVIDLHGQRKQSVHIARLWVPRYWTPWVGDCLLPKTLFPRDHPIDCLQRVWRDDEWTALRFLRRGQTADIRIDNYGAERPADYQARRAAHLRRIGREDRWTELKREIET